MTRARIAGALALALQRSRRPPPVAAGGWLGGRPAPASVERALTVRLGESTARERALAGSVIPAQAIVGASLDAKRYVWAAPTDKGCVLHGHDRAAQPDRRRRLHDGVGRVAELVHSTATARSIIGGRIARCGATRPRARSLIRRDGTTAARRDRSRRGTASSSRG